MRIKYRIIITLFLFVFVVLCVGVTFSVFNSSANLRYNDQNIAKFVFNTESLNQLELSLVDLNPGYNKDYEFSIANNGDEKASEVTIDYQLTIKTYHMIPLTIELFKIIGSNEELLMVCDESYTRNTQNELVCNSDVQNMNFSSSVTDYYKLSVSFPDTYDGTDYANLVDFINIEVRSWQRIN